MCCQLLDETEEIVERRACKKKTVCCQLRDETEEKVELPACEKIVCCQLRDETEEKVELQACEEIVCGSSCEMRLKKYLSVEHVKRKQCVLPVAR